MWCRTVRKLIYDYVDGLVDGRMAGKMKTHLGRCVKCAAAEDDARDFSNTLAAWVDFPAPETKADEVCVAFRDFIRRIGLLARRDHRLEGERPGAQPGRRQPGELLIFYSWHFFL